VVDLGASSAEVSFAYITPRRLPHRNLSQIDIYKLNDVSNSTTVPLLPSIKPRARFPNPLPVLP
jgi:hypothetical protein